MKQNQVSEIPNPNQKNKFNKKDFIKFQSQSQSDTLKNELNKRHYNRSCNEVLKISTTTARWVATIRVVVNHNLIQQP